MKVTYDGGPAPPRGTPEPAGLPPQGASPQGRGRGLAGGSPLAPVPPGRRLGPWLRPRRRGWPARKSHWSYRVRPLYSLRLVSWLKLATPTITPTDVPPAGPKAEVGGDGLGRGLAPVAGLAPLPGLAPARGPPPPPPGPGAPPPPP